MCELLAMNARKPATLSLSFRGFAKRGGQTAQHADGWGIAFYEDTGCRLFIDNLPACSSPLAHWVQNYPIKSQVVMAHIRKATQGGAGLSNCHPFQREWQRKVWSFSHNGHLLGFAPQLDGTYRPIGHTDSELAFCYLLQQLRQQFADDRMPEPLALAQALHLIATDIAQFGNFNFLLTDGDLLFAYCTSKLHYLQRQAPFSEVELVDEDFSIDLRKVNGQDDRMAIVATAPLTLNEAWQAFEAGTLKLFRSGQLLWESGVLPVPYFAPWADPSQSSTSGLDGLHSTCAAPL
jgi:predicted glutamine amidotransferase